MADTEQCIVQNVSQLKSAHFTVCQKPWNCYKGFVNRLCADLHRSWFTLRGEAEAFFDMPVTKACPKIGKQHYIRMNLTRARMPLDKLPFVVPDDSPDRIDPIP
eukprot:CAMPEP_0173318478 /NCGR_PEP_ID=MMETSP1143-20121109/27679_1 /TAXON_ID=483371 /ORGANISM="non described non described, Strain CCMP2298" /LENGTH=103 /DNA_ID=CAMNT_0014261727 /DNA_START=4 /DNA_END=312 /DNA_ORIENTATION=+